VGSRPKLLLGVAALGSFGACSGSKGTPQSDAGRDAVGSVDRPSIDRVVDAPGSADRHDGSADRHDSGADRPEAGVGCAPLDPSVYPASQCAATWADVVAYPGCLEQGYVQQLQADCGLYHTVTQFGADSNLSCSYDAQSGQLVAVSLYSLQGPQCWGPPGGLGTSCPNAISTTLCAADAGASGDGGQGICLSTELPPFFSWNAPCPDTGTPCYANCQVFVDTKYVGCVTGSGVATRCYASCAECP
jgi:hypothetical protein